MSLRGAGRTGAILVLAAFLSSALLLWAVGDLVFAAAFAAGLIAAGALIHVRTRPRPSPIQPAAPSIDIDLLRAALDKVAGAAAITDEGGAMRCANDSYAEWFGSFTPPVQLFPDLEAAATSARRAGSMPIELPIAAGRPFAGEVRRAGADGSWLLWSFTRSAEFDLAAEAERMIEGEAGARVGEAGIMTALADAEGRLVTANRAFIARALGDPEQPAAGIPLVDLIAIDDYHGFTLASEGESATPLRILQVPIAEGAAALTLFILLDEGGAATGTPADGPGVGALLDRLPHGLALVNGDGRFTCLNPYFRKAAGIDADARPIYPSDLVVDEDKAVVSDAVRRFARGRAMTGDLAIRLKSRPDDSVALTLAGARGLCDVAVILSLKDSSEEDRLKRQVAQATKMQAVGQLAGGVAHDFNNILTAILGYCDLMLMRHTPGDSDYDDIQQIRSNSNRAAALTRQLLAFSRQQTLRPQILQLPDVIAEVSNLLKRLIGETVTLQVKHDRNLGAVRADPGQLEQVIVNLAVNARDAMLSKYPSGGGTLTVHTYAVSPDDVRDLGIEIMPVVEYTALRVTDTGYGIPQDILPKIFEPFFTTKEVGKGTGLGLSTVYGIVKQSGGFIFAGSEEGEGTSFVIYLPVHRAEMTGEAPRGRVRQKTPELWGTGTVLLVEDEAMVRAVAERALTRHGYSVLTAENGEAALEILAGADHVDLMISDVVMPAMDGPTTAREARKARPDLPILFISGYAEEQLRKSIDLDGVSFLAKPFSVQKLAEAAREALAGAAK